MDIFEFSYPQFILFILVLVRISSILILAPIFGSRTIPFQIKAGLSLLMTLVIFPLLKLEILYFDNIYFFVQAIFYEVIIGMVIGYASDLMFGSISLAGHMIGFQMGYAIVNVFDPTTSSQVSVISEMKYILGILIFLTLGAHYWIIQAMVESFRLIPLQGARISGALIKILIELFGSLFITSIKIAAPVVAAMIFVNVSLGLIAKTVPQMNVFMVGFPLQIGIGLLLLGFTMPIFYHLIKELFLTTYGKTLLTLLRAMQGG